MKIEVLKETVKADKTMDLVYAQTLTEMAAEDKNVVALDADLMTVVNMNIFRDAYPDRFINAGIAEANMIGMAAGLSATGKVPYAHSFAPFVSRRAYDQTFISGGYAQQNIRVVGSDAGITASFNGGTHMCLEDMGIMRGIPNMTVLEPTDNVMLENLIKQTKDMYGMFYIRLLRSEPVSIYAEGSEFEIGKGIVLKGGKDVTLVASGIMTAEALKAADMLEAEGISAKVVNLFTWKPMDTELIGECAKETGAIVTCENHNVVNGLYSAVCEAVIKTTPVPVESVGVQDHFGEVGAQDYLQEKFGMRPSDIVAKAKKAIARK